MLTDGLERVLSPLKKIKVPVYEFSLMMTIALRMIPTLIEEVDKITSAQKARGAQLETGNLFQRAKGARAHPHPAVRILVSAARTSSPSPWNAAVTAAARAVPASRNTT